jgi:hypothetical protein
VVGLRLAIPAVLIAAVVAACITYIAIPSPQERIEVDRPSQPAAPKETTRFVTGMPIDIQRQAMEDPVAAFQRSADAILKQAQNANALASGDEHIIRGPVPLPRKRPIVRP